MDDEDDQAQGSAAGRPTGGPSFVLILLFTAVFLLALGVALGEMGYGEPVRGPDEGPGAERSGQRLAPTLIICGVYGLALGLVLSWLGPETTARPVEAVTDTQPLCIACCAPFIEGAHFCPACGAPLTAFATTAPYESIYAEAWCLGRAMHGPSRPIHLLVLGFRFAGTVVGVLLGLGAIFFAQPAFEASWMVLMAVSLFINWRLFFGCRANQEGLDPDDLDPDRGPYGAPPYWTFDRWWVPREEEDAPEAGAS